jgi:eukaryotic-like serine/threonine-protein kinase
MWLGTPSVGVIVGGRYRLTRALGGGGMSVVFAAENTVTSKQVALKFLHASLADRPDAKARLLREARAGSRIKHRNVVDVYDVGFEGETMFLVMDLLEGDTLAKVLETSVMSVPALLQLLIPAMRGVAEAHRLGVIHRDIKPDNLFLAREVDQSEPVVTVLDFGIAKLEGDTLRTHSGRATGTPLFMAIEQIRGERNLDARVDVYGFGVILYMALAGRLPITADTWPELIYKLTSSVAAPLSSLRPDLPAELCAIVARAMAREREDRTATLEQLIGGLTPFATGPAELGVTRLVVYGQAPHAMPTTVPTPALSASASAPGQTTEGEVGPGPVRSQPALQTPTKLARAPGRRWPLALVGLGALAMLGAQLPSTRAPSSVTPSPMTPAVVLAPPPAQLLAPVPASVARTVTPDAGAEPPSVALVPAKPPLVRPRRQERAPPSAVEPAVTPEPTPRRRRLASEDFFVSRP